MGETTAYNGPERVFHLDILTILRVFALSFVLLLHCSISSLYAYGFHFEEPYSWLMKTPAWAGVWIFLIISGLLAGRSFFEGYYEFSPKGIARYYLKRLIKIGLPTFVVVLLLGVLVYPTAVLTDYDLLIRILTFRYNGIPDITGITHLWFISTIFWLYILTPVFCAIIQFIDKRVIRKEVWVVGWVMIIALGYLYRQYLSCQIDTVWVYDVFVNVISNIDIFLSGLLLYKILPSAKKLLGSKETVSIIFKVVSFLIFIALVFLNVYRSGHETAEFYHSYQYQFETLYEIAVGFVIICFYDRCFVKQTVDYTLVKKHPQVIIEFIGSLSFEIYLIHAVIYHNLSLVISG